MRRVLPAGFRSALAPCTSGLTDAPPLLGA
jgi:hypothetical protein